MSERTRRAAKLALNAGAVAAFLGLVNAVVLPIEDPLPGGRLTYVLVVPPLSFALFFALVFPLAYFFPPNSTEVSRSLRFPGARKVIWPVVGLLAGAVIWLVLRSG